MALCWWIYELYSHHCIAVRECEPRLPNPLAICASPGDETQSSTFWRRRRRFSRFLWSDDLSSSSSTARHLCLMRYCVLRAKYICVNYIYCRTLTSSINAAVGCVVRRVYAGSYNNRVVCSRQNFRDAQFGWNKFSAEAQVWESMYLHI